MLLAFRSASAGAIRSVQGRIQACSKFTSRL
jgi:hypothetical protein